jgi:hypothetical protein
VNTAVERTAGAAQPGEGEAERRKGAPSRGTRGAFEDGEAEAIEPAPASIVPEEEPIEAEVEAIETKASFVEAKEEIVLEKEEVARTKGSSIEKESSFVPAT